MKRHPKYKLKKGDTIRSITERFGVEEALWKRYHDNMCPLDDVISNSIPVHLAELFLLPELWDKEDMLNTIPSEKQLLEKKVSQPVEFGFQNTLPLRFCPIELCYGVALILNNGSKTNSIKYEIKIRWVGKGDEQHTIEINKVSDIYINNKLPSSMVDQIAAKAASTLYPLQLVVKRSDGIIDISNFADIQKRWSGSKEQIRNYFAGEALEKYFRLNDKVFENKYFLLISLCNDWFFHAYFNKIYQTYGSKLSLSHIIPAPFIFDKSGVEYKVEQTVSNCVNEQGFVNIDMIGSIFDKRSVIDIENKLDFAYYESDTLLVGEYIANYKLEPKYNTIEKLKLVCSLELPTKIKKISIIVTKIK